MGLDISSADIDRTHWLGAPPKQSGKGRPVKFVRYNNWRKISTNKKLLKGTKVYITAQRAAKLKEAKEKFGFNGDDKTKIYFDWHCGVILRRKKLKSGFLWLSYFLFCYIMFIIFGKFNFRRCRSPATSVMELFPILVNNFLLIAYVTRTSVLDVAGALDPPLLLEVLFSRVMFFEVLVSEFALIIGLLWQCTLIQLNIAF